jgi:SOS-response transcriptional repressor LexA
MSGQINIVGERIAQARRALGREWTQEKVVDAVIKIGVKISRSWLANVESGRTRKVFSKELQALSEVLNKPIDYFSELQVRDKHAFYGGDVEAVEGLKTQYVPVLGVVSAENFNLSFESAVPDEVLPIPIEQKERRRIFALKISGRCMEPKAHDGDYVFVVETEYVEDGKLAVIRLNGESTLKRIYRHKDYVELRPDNPSFKPLKVKSGDLHIIGKVILIAQKP